MVAQREDDLEAYIHGRTQDLVQIINYKLLQARSDLQELALAPVFAEFPGRMKDWRYRLDDTSEQMREAFDEKLEILGRAWNGRSRGYRRRGWQPGPVLTARGWPCSGSGKRRPSKGLSAEKKRE